VTIGVRWLAPRPGSGADPRDLDREEARGWGRLLESHVRESFSEARVTGQLLGALLAE